MKTGTDVCEEILDSGIASSPEWQSVVDGHCNLLLEGPQAWTEAVLCQLAPLLETPVICVTSHRPRRFPAGDCGALVLRDVDALRRDEQRLLLEWLDDGRQVISATTHSLFPLVVRGSFDEALYYRLNVIRLKSPSDGTD
jgi:hypothetical protein